MTQLQEACSLGILTRVENHIAVLTVVASTWIPSLDLAGTAEEFRTSGNVNGMQALMVVAAGIPRHGHKVHCPIWAKRAVDHRCIRYADLGRYLATSMRVACCFAFLQGGNLP